MTDTTQIRTRKTRQSSADTVSRLSPRARKALLTAHVATAVGLIGADLVLLALGISGARGADPETVYPAMRLVAAAVLAPLALSALGIGVLQGLLGPYGLVRHGWVATKLVITTALTGLVLLVVVPGLGQAADAATGSLPQEYLTDSQRVMFAVTPSVALALLVLMVVLGMYKPGSRGTGRTVRRR